MTDTKLEKVIEKHEAELGSEEEKNGLIGKHLEADKMFEDAHKTYKIKSEKLEDNLRDKANKTGTGIKHNRAFGDPNYNLPKIKKDIDTVIGDSYARISDEQVQEYHDLLKEEPKKVVKKSASFDLKYSDIISKAKELIEKKIRVSDPIQELLNDAALATWVRAGQEHHKDKRDTCAFCGNDLPADLWNRLDRHFNQESEELRTAIDGVLAFVDEEIHRIPDLLKVKDSDFYSNFHQEINTLAEDFATHSAACCGALVSIKKQLEKRKDDIFEPLSFDEPTFKERNLNDVRELYEVLRMKSNDFTASLSTDQSNAREALRLNEVFKFITDINYADEYNSIKVLKEAMGEAKKYKDSLDAKVEVKRVKISELKVQLKDERKGAERVNDYLNHFFGHQFLSLKASEETSEDGTTGYRFVVTRGGMPAFHLSGGERSLIAFCYFVAKLEDIETKGHQPIIWIDDPISSLDSNHIFFVYSLINAKIVNREQYDEGREINERNRIKQLFISTHNLDFLKYLKRLPGAWSSSTSEYFIINRADQISDVSLMPRYLKDYVTEFNFLFHQIYKCAYAKIGHDENHDCYYSFGNNARKFLEAFLYYKYPNAVENDKKLERFFGDDPLAASLTERVNNEFSHSAGVLERSAVPIDVPEMKSAANFILRKIKERDPDQYSALLESIGETG